MSWAARRAAQAKLRHYHRLVERETALQVAGGVAPAVAHATAVARAGEDRLEDRLARERGEHENWRTNFGGWR